MKNLEIIHSTEKGFRPLLIKEQWQIGQITYDESFDINNIKTIDIHFKTDESFILLNGKAILITASLNNEKFIFQTELMKTETVYNIPVNTWHNIALFPNTCVMIVENKNSHLEEYEIKKLSKNEIKTLKEELKKYE